MAGGIARGEFKALARTARVERLSTTHDADEPDTVATCGEPTTGIRSDSSTKPGLPYLTPCGHVARVTLYPDEPGRLPLIEAP